MVFCYLLPGGREEPRSPLLVTASLTTGMVDDRFRNLEVGPGSPKFLLHVIYSRRGIMSDDFDDRRISSIPICTSESRDASVPFATMGDVFVFALVTC